MKNHDGFTLIELMVVIAIIGILAAIAVPNFMPYIDKAYLSEGYELSSPIKKDILDYYDHLGTFPKNNLELGFPDEIKGKYVESIKINNGSIEIIYNQQIKSYTQAVITLHPVVNENYPTGPVTWDEKRSF